MEPRATLADVSYKGIKLYGQVTICACGGCKAGRSILIMGKVKDFEPYEVMIK